MMTMLRHMFTGRDNATHDLGRVLWAGGVAWWCGLGAWAVAHGQAFDPITSATGLGLVLGAGAGALKLKASTEP